MYTNIYKVSVIDVLPVVKRLKGTKKMKGSVNKRNDKICAESLTSAFSAKVHTHCTHKTLSACNKSYCQKQKSILLLSPAPASIVVEEMEEETQGTELDYFNAEKVHPEKWHSRAHLNFYNVVDHPNTMWKCVEQSSHVVP